GEPLIHAELAEFRERFSPQHRPSLSRCVNARGAVFADDLMIGGKIAFGSSAVHQVGNTPFTIESSPSRNISACRSQRFGVCLAARLSSASSAASDHR